jgi:hypothetical protein
MQNQTSRLLYNAQGFEENDSNQPTQILEKSLAYIVQKSIILQTENQEQPKLHKSAPN